MTTPPVINPDNIRSRMIEREMRRADDDARRMQLAGARQQVRRDMDQVMGQTA